MKLSRDIIDYYQVERAVCEVDILKQQWLNDQKIKSLDIIEEGQRFNPTLEEEKEYIKIVNLPANVYMVEST